MSITKESTYTGRWIKEKLGITRDMIRNYIEAGIIDEETKDMRGTYQRKYTKDEVKKIWGTKVLIKMGYKTSEISKIINQKENFYESLCQKVEEMEREKEEKEKILNFVKTIKLTGNMPKTKIGKVKFDDFIDDAIEYWNIYDNDVMVNGIEKALVKKFDDFDEEDIRKLIEQMEKFGVQKTQCLVSLGTYINIIAELKDLEINNRMVITAVKMLYNFIINDYFAIMEVDEKTKPSKIIKDSVKINDSDMAIMNKNVFGEDGVKFILDAVDYYEKEYYESEE